MRNAVLADRIPSPISRGCDLPMESFPRHLEELRFGGMYALLADAARFSRAVLFCAVRRLIGRI